MSLQTCAVTCTMHGQDGMPEPGATFEFRLSRYEVYQGFVVPESLRVVADSDGHCVADLWPNQLGSTESVYEVTMRSASGKTQRIQAVVPNEIAANLHDIASLPAYPGKPDTQFQMEQAILAKQNAEAAMDAAVIARDAAQLAESGSVAAAVVSTTQASIATTKAADAAASAADAAASAADAAASSASTSDAHISNTDNPHAVTKAQVGLGNVDNTSDAAKPVSTAQQAALSTKVGKTDDETITGIKTFGSSPLVPAGASGLQAVAAQEVALLATAHNAYRNKLINGGFDVFQRDHLTSVGDDAYCLDRWYVLTQSGSVTVEQTTDPESGAPFGVRLTQPNASAKRIGLAQIIESKNIRQFASQAMNLFARVKLSSSGSVRYAVIEHTGTADVVTSDVVSNWSSTTFTPSNFFIAGVNIIKTGTVTPGAATWGSVNDWSSLGAGVKNVIIMFWTEAALAQNGTFEINRAQYEPGVVATPYEWRINELALCAPYARWNGALAGWSFSTTSVTGLAVDFGSDPMRSAPSASLLFGTEAIHDVGTAFRNASALGTSLHAWGGYMACTTTTTTVNKFHNLLAGVVLFEAEL